MTTPTWANPAFCPSDLTLADDSVAPFASRAFQALGLRRSRPGSCPRTFGPIRTHERVGSGNEQEPVGGCPAPDGEHLLALSLGGGDGRQLVTRCAGVRLGR